MPGEAQRPTLVRAISRFDLTAAIVNGVIGSAIFGQPAKIAELTGSWSPLAYVIAGVGMLMVVLCFAEVASRFSEGGGAYVYCRDAYGPLTGFFAGWLLFWSRLTAYAANLNLFADFSGVLVPAATGDQARLVVLAIVSALLVAINVAGVRRASWTINAFTIAKLTPLVLLIILGLPRISGEVLATQIVGQYHWTEAVLLLVFAYGGFEAPLIPAAEAKNPRRDTAPALLMGIGIVATVYVLVQLVVVGVLPEAARSKTAVADAFGVLIGPTGATFVAVGALLSTYGYSAGATLQAPRLLLALAERRELPRPLAHVHERFHTPDVSIVAFALAGFALSAAGSFAANATFSAIVRLAIFALTCIAVVVFRRRFREEASFRIPAGPLVAALGVLFCAWMLTTRTFDQMGLLLALCVFGFILRFLTRFRAPA
jgi:APA family basic amino acid/polyamine antiporter